MKSIVLTLTFLIGLSAFSSDTPIAVVQGTNVVFVCVADTNRFAPKPGMSNVVITTAELSVITKGWSYSGGEFRDPKGAAISNGNKARIDRAKLIDAAIAELNSMQASGANAVANWASLSAAQKDAAQKKTIQAVIRCSQIIELLLREQRLLLELKEETK